MRLTRVQLLRAAAPLRAVLLVAFVLVSAFQSVAYADTRTHQERMTAQATQVSHQDSAEHKHAGAATHDGQHDTNGKSSGASQDCEVHCAPCQGIPVTCPLVMPVVERTYDVSRVAVLFPGDAPTLKRPPKS